MCRRIQCRTCKKPSYAGCGAHVESVLADVPVSERCSCREDKARAPTQSVWSRLFGKT